MTVGARHQEDKPSPNSDALRSRMETPRTKANSQTMDPAEKAPGETKSSLGWEAKTVDEVSYQRQKQPHRPNVVSSPLCLFVSPSAPSSTLCVVLFAFFCFLFGGLWFFGVETVLYVSLALPLSRRLLHPKRLVAFYSRRHSYRRPLLFAIP